MHDVVSVLPLMKHALDQIESEDVRARIDEYFSIIRTVSQYIFRHYSSSFLGENIWCRYGGIAYPVADFFLGSFKSRTHDVDELKQRIATLKTNIHFGVDVDTRQAVSQNQEIVTEIRTYPLF